MDYRFDTSSNTIVFFVVVAAVVFFNWDSPHARLKQPLRGMELQEKKSTKKITGYRKSV